MSCEPAPQITVEAKRSFAVVPVGFDWHDYLALVWSPGRKVFLGEKIRLRRNRSRGLQFRCTTAGVTGFREPVWPIAITESPIRDGTAVWTPESVAADSLRTTIVDSQWPDVSGLTLSNAHDADLRYMIHAGGGESGQIYEITQQVTFANGERDEGIALLPVVD
jgi:hypothetical protein